MIGEKRKRVLIPIGNGSSLLQTGCLSSTLGKFGAEVVIASVNDTHCEMSHGEKVCFVPLRYMRCVLSALGS
jgi:hypothetical protein